MRGVDRNFSGIYEIRSTVRPERFYIGSAVSLYNRWSAHLCTLRKNIHRTPKLQNHYNKHGESDLVFTIISLCQKEELICKEQFFLDECKPFFNTTPTAGSQLGLKHSEKTKRKISLAKKGCDYWTGRKHTEESKELMRQAHLGKKLAEEHRMKLSARLIGNKCAVGSKGQVGRVRTPEENQKTREGVNRYYARVGRTRIKK